MTSPTSSFKGLSLSTGLPFSVSLNQNQSAHVKNFKDLLMSRIPITKESIDHQGNRSRLWSLKSNTFFAVISHANGRLSVILSDRIINSCTGLPLSWDNLARLQRQKIDLAYVPEQKKLVVFPYLRAAGKDDLITQVVEKSLNPKPSASWTPPPFNETRDTLGHIFVNKRTHLSKDTPENRAYILSAVSDPANRRAINSHGLEMYDKIMPDGYRAWAHVKNGVVTNGGRGSPWFRSRWVPDSDNQKGGKMEDLPLQNKMSTYKERVQAERITEVYNASNGKRNQWQPHPLEVNNAARDVGGVRHQTGIILDLLEELQEGNYREHLFFLPAFEGKNLLREEEILQIIREVAQGIYIHDTIPFFSLNMNSDYQQYPIIHPAYQDTYVGYVISMLDYYLKGFWTGQVFTEDFALNWNKDPVIEEKFLREHSISIQELCKAEKPFANFSDTIRILAEEEGFSTEQLASLSQHPVVFSCRMIGKQKGIHKTDNLFVIDGDVELVYTVEWTPVGEEQEAYFRVLDRACEALCTQIKQIGFTAPAMQKWLAALKLMNFFSGYFRTLQEGEKVPRFQKPISLDKEKVCPPIFPPIPYPQGPFVEFDLADFLQALSSADSAVLKGYCQDNYESSGESISKKEHVKTVLSNVLKGLSVKERSSSQLSQEELEVFVDVVMNALKARYLFTDRQMEKLFVNLGIKQEPHKLLSTEELLVGIDTVKPHIVSAITQTQQRISQSKSYGLPYNEEIKTLDGLQEAQKILNDFLPQWVRDPLKALVNTETWFFDLASKQLSLRAKNADGERLKVFGGYEPNPEDTRSEESVLGRGILERHAKQLSQLEDEGFLSLEKKELKGYLFKLPIEDSFPVSSNGIPYNTMMLHPTFTNPADAEFLSALHAIKESNEAAFAEIGKNVVDWNRADMFGKKAIHYAAMTDSPFFLKVLIDKKADLLGKDAQGWTALHCAAAAGNIIGLELLLQTDPSLLNVSALNGETPIYLAAQNNQLLCVKKLLESDADLGKKPAHGWSALMSAMHNGHEEMALLLVETGLDLEHSWRGGKTALHFAIEMKMEKVLKELIKRGVDKNPLYNGQKPIFLAVAHGWQKGIDMLLGLEENPPQEKSWCSVM